MTSKLVVNTIEADTGISSVSFASSISMSSTSKFHFSAAGIDIGADTNINRPASGVLGFNINSAEKLRIDSNGAVMIRTTTAGAHSSDLTIGDAASGTAGRIMIRSASNAGGYINFQDTTGSSVDGALEYNHVLNSFNFYFGSQERFRIHTQGMIGLSGANYGTSGQVLTSGGTGSPVSWTTITGTTINNQADNRVLTATGSANTLNAESNVHIDGSGRLMVGTTTEGHAEGDDLTIATSGVTGITIRSGTGSAGNIFFSDATSGSAERQGIIRYDHADDAMKFNVNNAERARISSAGFVGINSAIPRTYLQVSKESSGYNPGNPTAFNSNNVLACFENSDDVEVTLLSPNNKKNIINFGDTDNVANSSIEYDHSVNHLIFKVNGGSERFRINNSGAFGLNGTNYGTSGQVLKSGGTNGAPTWGSAGGHTETYARVVFGAVYDTNSGYIVHNITSGSSNGITVDTTNERVTPTVAGTYLVIYNAHWGGLHSSGATYYNRITKNGSEIISSNFSAYNSGTHMHTVMTTTSMNGSSDYIQFEFYENKSGAAAYVNHKSRAVVILLDT